MPTRVRRRDQFVTRQVFPTWSIEVPLSMAETFVNEGLGYWHAYAFDRSISLTSIVVKDGYRPVPAQEIVSRLPREDGTPFEEMPPGLIGWGCTDDADETARAGRLLSGVVAVDGHVLLATITCDDESWSRRVWLSIRNQPVSPVSAALARARQRLRAPAGVGQ
jgi:hypothetical protein